MSLVMNSTANILASNQAKISPQNQTGQARGPQPFDQPSGQAATVRPHKESGGYQAPFWQEYHQEIKLEKEIEAIGLQKIEQGKVPLPKKIAQEMGIEHQISPEQKSFPLSSEQGPKVPLSDQQIILAKKAGQIKKSITWLAWFCWKQLAKAGLVLQLAGDKIVRVKTRSAIAK